MLLNSQLVTALQNAPDCLQFGRPGQTRSSLHVFE